MIKMLFRICLNWLEVGLSLGKLTFKLLYNAGGLKLPERVKHLRLNLKLNQIRQELSTQLLLNSIDSLLNPMIIRDFHNSGFQPQ